MTTQGGVCHGDDREINLLSAEQLLGLMKDPFHSTIHKRSGASPGTTGKSILDKWKIFPLQSFKRNCFGCGGICESATVPTGSTTKEVLLAPPYVKDLGTSLAGVSMEAPGPP